jgi:hypothetical protein
MLAAPLLSLLALLAACAAGGPPVEPPPPPPAPPATDPPALATPADDLLRRLERSADDLRTFSSSVLYRSYDAVLEQQELRSGELVYEVGGERKRLGIFFDRVVRGTARREHRRDYIFDGHWLVEVDHERKLLIKRQIAEPGRAFDPLRLGEGPFPLPIGQKRDEVVARFEVAILEKASDPWLAERLAGRAVLGLLLVPRPGERHAKDFARVELFYDAATLLPAGVHAVEPKGDTKTVYLFEQKRNSAIDEDRLTIPQPDREWRIDVQPWRE